MGPWVDGRPTAAAFGSENPWFVHPNPTLQRPSAGAPHYAAAGGESYQLAPIRSVPPQGPFGSPQQGYSHAPPPYLQASGWRTLQVGAPGNPPFAGQTVPPEPPLPNRFEGRTQSRGQDDYPGSMGPQRRSPSPIPSPGGSEPSDSPPTQVLGLPISAVRFTPHPVTTSKPRRGRGGA